MGATAQSRATTADLSGVVLDSSGAVVPGAAVVVTNSGTGLTQTATSDGAGRFSFAALPPGLYNMRATYGAFAPRALERIVLTVGSSLDLIVTLGVAGTQEEVTVVGDAPLADRRSTSVASTVSVQQIAMLPINGRNFISFASMAPGVSTDRTPQQGASRTSGLTFAGQRARSNNITVDGLDNNDETVGSVRAAFSQEAVQEFQVLTASYPAEFGKAAGGVVNIVTKSGTNNPAGTAFYFFRDKAINAKEYFEKFTPAGQHIQRSKAPFRQAQFGGIFGGPLKRDRSFFFVSFERLDMRASNFVTIDDETPVRHPVVAGLVLGTPAQILRTAGFRVETGHVPYAIRSTQFLARVDHQIAAGQHLAVRFNAAADLNENIEPFGGQVARSRAAALESRDQMLAVSHTDARPSRKLNELRFQIANRDQIVTSLDPACGGRCDANDQGGPTLEVIGVASVGRQRFTPSARDNVRYQIVDSFSAEVGSHQLKGGVDYSFLDGKNQSLPLHFGGRYIFFQEIALPLVAGLPPFPVSSIQAVALGLPTAYVQGYGNADGPYDYSDVSLFAQDDWRIRDGLTFKSGLRYQKQFWPRVVLQVPGYPRTFPFPADNDNVAPRLAVAWTPTADRRTTMHASYGVFFDNLPTSIAGIANVIDGRDGVRTLVLSAPRSFAAWAAQDRRLTEPVARELAGGVYPSVQISIDPGLKTPYAHHASLGVNREIARSVSASVNILYVRGFGQLGTIDYNPVVPELGSIPGVGFVRRPADIDGIPGTSASVLQYTSFGETWYRGLTISIAKQFSGRSQLVANYTLSKAEDNSTDFQSAFIPQNNGRGRNPADPEGLPLGFDPDDERGPSLEDQRHRLVLTGIYAAPAGLYVSSTATIASGRPYNILAGADLNADRDGGAFPPDRARRDPALQSTSVGRNAGTLPRQMVVDVRVSKEIPVRGTVRLETLVEIFNLLNRTNYTDLQNIFGTGEYPANPTPGFGEFTQSGPGRQVQLAVKLHF